jgi:peroxiredoxin
VLLGILVIILVAAIAASRSQRPSESVSGEKAAIGSPAPSFTTQDLDGHRVALADFRGRPLLINFWATWCTPCQTEMPAIQAAAQRHQAQGIQVLAVDYRQRDVGGIRRFLAGLRVNFHVALDVDGKIARAYGATVGLPTSVFIDREGKVADVHVGQMNASVIEAGIAKAVQR